MEPKKFYFSQLTHHAAAKQQRLLQRVLLSALPLVQLQQAWAVIGPQQSHMNSEVPRKTEAKSQIAGNLLRAALIM